MPRSFGWYKILGKHNITSFAAVCNVTRYGKPKREKKKGSTNYHAQLIARLRACQKTNPDNCKTIQTIPVTQAFNLRRAQRNDPSRFGVVTTYCKGIEVCPSWVTAALKTASTKSRSATPTFELTLVR